MKCEVCGREGEWNTKNSMFELKSYHICPDCDSRGLIPMSEIEFVFANFVWSAIFIETKRIIKKSLVYHGKTVEEMLTFGRSSITERIGIASMDYAFDGESDFICDDDGYGVIDLLEEITEYGSIDCLVEETVREEVEESYESDYDDYDEGDEGYDGGDDDDDYE